MVKIKINGGNPLQGEIKIEVNKNAVLPTLCATMLSSEDCVMHNVPQSPDVQKILQAIEELGGVYTWDNKKLTVNCKNLQDKPVSDCVADIQSAILFVGPLLARFGNANVPVAIGCKLGYRGPEDHIEYLSRLGVSCSFDQELHRVKFSVNKSKLSDDRLIQLSNEVIKKHFIFSEASVTPTENLLIFLSCVTKFDVQIDGIAQEPHVRFLTKILRQMGMTIVGKGSILTTTGIFGNTKGFTCDFTEEPDFIDFYGHAVMVALSKGSVLLQCSITPAILHMVVFLEKTGVHCEVYKTGILIQGTQSKFELSPGFPKADDHTYKMNPKPWPGFPVDSIPSFIALQALHVVSRKIVVNNWMYEDGLSYVSQLDDLGAQVKVFDTGFGRQKALIETYENYVSNISKYNVLSLDGVPVIEGVRAIISYALQREGETIIKNIDPILRRSPDFISKLQTIGADIEIID
jgi:UDP-N-acetylglucosamine 1-carboxyvinyltransferase